jgi:hypothetical protein
MGGERGGNVGRRWCWRVKCLQCSNAKIHHFLSEQCDLGPKGTSLLEQYPVLMVISATDHEHIRTSNYLTVL